MSSLSFKGIYLFGGYSISLMMTLQAKLWLITISLLKTSNHKKLGENTNVRHLNMVLNKTKS